MPSDPSPTPPNGDSAFRFDPEWEIPPAELKRLLDEPREMLLLDVRRLNEWNFCRLPGAVLIPLHELPARYDELADRKTQRIIIYCHHGVRSLRAAEFLRSAGFESAVSLAGGIEAYSRLIDPSIPRY